MKKSYRPTRNLMVDFIVTVNDNGFINKSTMRKLFKAMYNYNHTCDCDFNVIDSDYEITYFSFERDVWGRDFEVYHSITIYNEEKDMESERETSYFIDYAEKSKGTFDYSNASYEKEKGEWY